MPDQLNIRVGQYTSKGRKEVNQDFHGVSIPKKPLLSSKGAALALSDGISSSDVSQIASETAIKSFLTDYYCTSVSWGVKKSVQRVLQATNAWLYAQTRQSQFRYNKNKGYVATFSGMVIKSTTAHLFHVGDSRIYRLAGQHLEQLTEDHRLWVSKEKSYLSRALGINQHIEIDYQTLMLTVGDTFVLATDGVYEHAPKDLIIEIIKQYQDDLDKAAKIIVDAAYQQGSTDNLTIQIVSIDALPQKNEVESYQQLTDLPLPPILEARKVFDGYTIIRELYASSRSHIYLATDNDTQQQVIIKTPSVDSLTDAHYLDHFLTEEWVAQRINSPHVLKAVTSTRKRHFLYNVTEFVEGQTLAQWMIDNPKPDIETVRDIIEQISKGLRAFHRQEMLHQDLRPNNIMIDRTGTVKIIDFGATYVAGIAETNIHFKQNHILGTAQYTAPEYYLGESGTTRSDLFSLGVICYYLLSGRLPYGTKVSQLRTRAAQRKLGYQSVLDDHQEIPAWVDDAIKKAVHPDPHKRYNEMSAFIYDLRHPSKAFLSKTRPPLIERKPILFWQSVSFLLFVTVLVLLGLR